MPGKGKLGPKGWEVKSRSKATRGSSAEVNAANNKLVKDNTALREELQVMATREEEYLARIATFESQQKWSNDLQRMENIRATLELFDHTSDKVWTEDGLPRVEAVCEFLIDDTVTREEIESALPGFVREDKKADDKQ